MFESLIKDFEKYHKLLDNNQLASMCGAFGEQILCEAFGWDKIDADGYDAISPIYESVGTVPMFNKKIGEAKIEIKTMSNFSSTKVLAYNSNSKAGKYDYLAIYMYHENRVSIIPHDELEELLNKPNTGKTINFNPKPKIVFGRQTDIIKFTPLTELFLKYEVKNFKHIKDK